MEAVLTKHVRILDDVEDKPKQIKQSVRIKSNIGNCKYKHRIFFLSNFELIIQLLLRNIMKICNLGQIKSNPNLNQKGKQLLLTSQI